MRVCFLRPLGPAVATQHSTTQHSTAQHSTAIVPPTMPEHATADEEV